MYELRSSVVEADVRPMQGTPKKTSKAKLDWLRATANIDIFPIKRPKDCKLKDGTAHATAVQELGAKRHGDWKQRTGECVTLLIRATK